MLSFLGVRLEVVGEVVGVCFKGFKGFNTS